MSTAADRELYIGCPLSLFTATATTKEQIATDRAANKAQGHKVKVKAARKEPK